MQTNEKAVNWDVVASIRASPRRKMVIDQLLEGPKFATEIGEAIDYSQATISNDLRWMRQQNPPLLECLTPDRPHHVIYALNTEGQKIAEYID